MYIQHFNFRELPFSITPNTHFFMNCGGHQEALNVLLVALRSGEGFIKITGEVGVGKTILCRKLLHLLLPDFVVAYIYNPYLKSHSLLYAIADKLGAVYQPDHSHHMLLQSITRSLLHIHRAGKRVVICMDEVQAMPIQTLETLRLLTNLETERRKLLQVVLFGQPELNILLEHQAVRQLKQRITFSFELLPLGREVLEHYIAHRLQVAGYTGEELFSKKARDLVYRSSHGIPRMINILCHKALMSGYGEGALTIKPHHVRLAIQDMAGPAGRRRRLGLQMVRQLFREII